MSIDINEIKKMDDLVEEYELNRYLSTEKSRRFWNGSEMRSDQLFQSWEQFALKRMANKAFGMTWYDMEDWGPKECRSFYNERLMEGRTVPKAHQLDLNDDAISGLLAAATDTARLALCYRWNNGFAFKNYRNRVYFAIDCYAAGLGEDAGALVRKIQKAEQTMASIMGELDSVVKTTNMSSRAKHLINYMKNNLNLADFLPNED